MALPKPLQESRLPWKADLDDQSAAPGPLDSWHAITGTLEWSLGVCQDDPSAPPLFALNLRNLASDEEYAHIFRTYPSLSEAVQAAEDVLTNLLDQLQTALLCPT